MYMGKAERTRRLIGRIPRIWLLIGLVLALDVALTVTFLVLRDNERASSVANHAHAHSEYASSIITTTEELLHFPGSLVKYEGCEDAEVNNCWQELRADRPFNEVIRYYEDALHNDGWVINTEHDLDSSTYLELLKDQSRGTAPMRRWLRLSISQWGEMGASIDLSWDDVAISPTSKSFGYSRRFGEGFISSKVLLDIQPQECTKRKVLCAVRFLLRFSPFPSPNAPCFSYGDTAPTTK